MRTGRDWFEQLVGFRETTGDDVRAWLAVDGATFTSSANERTLTCGTLTVPSLTELRNTAPRPAGPAGSLSVREVVAEVGDLHADPDNAGALFQVASQFNLLEMIGPRVTPERGVTGYVNDPTQGPACAVACGAGTIYRNWLVPIDGLLGQSEARQIDCLADLGHALGNEGGRLWTMSNGYALATPDGLDEIADRLADMTTEARDQLMGAIQIGVHSDTEVTLPDTGHLVTQAFCSALPIGYTGWAQSRWEPFARLVLEAAYEATMLAGLANAERTGNARVYLTLLGGGSFGNESQWILDAMERAFDRSADADLDVAIVSFGSSRPGVQRLLRGA